MTGDIPYHTTLPHTHTHTHTSISSQAAASLWSERAADAASESEEWTKMEATATRFNRRVRPPSVVYTQTESRRHPLLARKPIACGRPSAPGCRPCGDLKLTGTTVGSRSSRTHQQSTVRGQWTDTADTQRDQLDSGGPVIPGLTDWLHPTRPAGPWVVPSSDSARPLLCSRYVPHCRIGSGRIEYRITDWRNRTVSKLVLVVDIH